MEIPIKIHDLGVPLFLETPIFDDNSLNPVIKAPLIKVNGHFFFHCLSVPSSKFNESQESSSLTIALHHHAEHIGSKLAPSDFCPRLFCEDVEGTM